MPVKNRKKIVVKKRKKLKKSLDKTLKILYYKQARLMNDCLGEVSKWS